LALGYQSPNQFEAQQIRSGWISTSLISILPQQHKGVRREIPNRSTTRLCTAVRRCAELSINGTAMIGSLQSQFTDVTVLKRFHMLTVDLLPV